MLHCLGCCGLVLVSYRTDGSRKAPTTALCSIVNQLDTARRFISNKVTRAKSPVVPNSIEIIRWRYQNGLRWD